MTWTRVGRTKYGPVYHGPDLFQVLAGPDGWMVERSGLHPLGNYRAQLVRESWGPFNDEQAAFDEAERRIRESQTND